MTFSPFDPINSPPPRSTRGLTDEEVSGLLHDAAERLAAPAGDPIERFLLDLAKRHPFRVRRILRDHKWLQGHAAVRGLRL